jgi:hypothetical protein
MREPNRTTVTRGSRTFFENGMNGHTAVSKLTHVGGDMYLIERTQDRPAITVFVADIYIAGEADIHEIQPAKKGVDCVVLIGFYNRYSQAAKELARELKVGLYDNREFFGAVNCTGSALLNYKKKSI